MNERKEEGRKDEMRGTLEGRFDNTTRKGKEGEGGNSYYLQMPGRLKLRRVNVRREGRAIATLSAVPQFTETLI